VDTTPAELSPDNTGEIIFHYQPRVLDMSYDRTSKGIKPSDIAELIPLHHGPAATLLLAAMAAAPWTRPPRTSSRCGQRPSPTNDSRTFLTAAAAQIGSCGRHRQLGGSSHAAGSSSY
jgi:hypothetical protein